MDLYYETFNNGCHIEVYLPKALEFLILLSQYAENDIVGKMEATFKLMVRIDGKSPDLELMPLDMFLLISDIVSNALGVSESKNYK